MRRFSPVRASEGCSAHFPDDGDSKRIDSSFRKRLLENASAGRSQRGISSMDAYEGQPE
jgi:hypothetical protein